MKTPPSSLIENSVDDLLQAAIEAIVEHGEPVEPTKGPNRELRGVTLRLPRPRVRLSRSESRGRAISALGELLWYLSGSAETTHIAHYISHYNEFDESGVIHGGYGPRLRGPHDRLAVVIERLRQKPSTRRAVVQLFDGDDLLEEHRDVPCTCSLQFLIRNQRLDLVVYMRSNDAFLGLPHDIFCFTMIQELVARSVGVELGEYIHMTASLHLYDRDAEKAQRFLEEGFFSSTAMPSMPEGDPMPAVTEMLGIERCLRGGADPRSVALPTDPYWADLARLLVVFELDRANRQDEVQLIMNEMLSDVYRVYVADRLDRKAQGQ